MLSYPEGVTAKPSAVLNSLLLPSGAQEEHRGGRLPLEKRDHTEEAEAVPKAFNKPWAKHQHWWESVGQSGGMEV